jgi:hypothetical protein
MQKHEAPSNVTHIEDYLAEKNDSEESLFTTLKRPEIAMALSALAIWGGIKGYEVVKGPGYKTKVVHIKQGEGISNAVARAEGEEATQGNIDAETNRVLEEELGGNDIVHPGQPISVRVKK